MWNGRSLSLLAFHLLLFCGALLCPAAHAAEDFSGARALTLLADLARDDFQGRKSGAPGGERTEEFIAQRFAEWGLEPAGENGGYFQTFPMLMTRERGARLELPDTPYGRIDFLYGDDFTFVTNSGSADVTAEVVIVGHGLCDSTRKWNDYGDLDASGRVVLIVRGTPENDYDWDLEATRDSTLHEAVRRGAVAVLYCQGDNPVHGGAVHEGSYFPRVPVLYVGQHIVDHLFQDTGRDRAAYEAAIARAPQPFATGKRMHVRTDVRLDPEASARNVLGVIRGDDPDRAREIIVVGGHMDHLGRDTRGLVYNGADDNASGTAVVMELARTLAASPPPARTILFAAFAAEEQGLLGSEAFVARPPVNFERVVAMINLDMTGHGDGRAGLGGGEQFPDVLRAFRAALDSSFADSVVVGRAWSGESSDHAPFRRVGIPTCNVWSEGDHHFGHSIADDFAWIDSTAIRTVGRTTAEWIRALASWPAPLAHPHREGRSLLRGSTGFDFDAPPTEAAPLWVAGGVHWFEAAGFARTRFTDEIDELARMAAVTDSVQLVDRIPQIAGAAWDGRVAHVVGLQINDDTTAPKNPDLLRDLHVTLVRWNRSPAAADSELISAFSREEVTFVIPPDPTWVSVLQDDARALVVSSLPENAASTDPRWVHELFDELNGFPRPRFFFLVSLSGPIDERSLAAGIARLGWDRVHLDLVPWAKRGDEEEIWSFLEELKDAGEFPSRHMWAMLGGNLEHAGR